MSVPVVLSSRNESEQEEQRVRTVWFPVPAAVCNRTTWVTLFADEGQSASFLNVVGSKWRR
jgi:hypothetical protein